jgi:hypothetical protein
MFGCDVARMSNKPHNATLVVSDRLYSYKKYSSGDLGLELLFLSLGMFVALVMTEVLTKGFLSRQTLDLC